MSQNGQWKNRILGYAEVDPESVLANEKNWRVHPKPQQDALSGILGDVGLVQSVIINRRTSEQWEPNDRGVETLVDGHLRVSLALSKGQKAIPAVFVDLTPSEEAEVLATIDPVAALAVADKEQLDALLREVNTTDAALQAMLADLAKESGLYLDKPKAEDPGAQVDKASELLEKWGVKLGDLWEIGKHRLICGDCTDSIVIEQLMGGEKAAVLWTDPPYGVDYVGKTKDALTLENDGAEGLLPLLIAAFKNATDGCVERAPWYIAHPAGALCLVFGDAIRSVGWQFHQTLIWVKDSMVLGHSDYHFKHEPIYYGFTPGSGRPGRGNHEGTKWHGDHAQVSVFEIPRPKRSEEHPTMKPPELIVRCIENSSAVGESVLDVFLGSGTTLVAAEQTGRIGYGCELSPAYVAVALERLAGMGLSPRLADG